MLEAAGAFARMPSLELPSWDEVLTRDFCLPKIAHGHHCLMAASPTVINSLSCVRPGLGDRGDRGDRGDFEGSERTEGAAEGAAEGTAEGTAEGAFDAAEAASSRGETAVAAS